jgi:hypothetical protein
MAHERLLDREEKPDPKKIHRLIGREVLPVWQDVLAYLDQHFSDYERELVFYSTQHGWAYRYRQEANQLCALFPERRSFSALLILNAAEDQKALDKINFFNAKLRELLNQPSTLPQGRWLWMRLEDDTDFFGLKLLLDIKESS